MARASCTETILKHLAACDENIDHALRYSDHYHVERLRAEHVALWRVLLDVDRAAAMEYRNRADVVDRALRVHDAIKRGI